MTDDTDVSSPAKCRAPAATQQTGRIRTFAPGDRDTVLAVNQANLPAVGSLTGAALDALVAQARATLVAEVDGRPAGLLICLDHTARYDSPNFAWLKERLGRFTYVDRIALAPDACGLGIGQRLYETLIARLAEDPATAGLPLACEVNTRPANPGSLRFHRRLGFVEIGTLDHGDKAVVFLSRTADPASGEASR